MGKVFAARAAYVGEICYICKTAIELGDRIIFLDGTDMAHESCVEGEVEKA